MTRHRLEVPAIASGKRLDLFIGEALSLSRAKVKALFETDAVRVNDRKARKGHEVSEGQKVDVELPEEAPREVVAQKDVPLTVLHEDESLVFVNKPAGSPSHPLEPGELGTIANALLARYPECAQASEDPREAGLCHRLDILTSGVLLAARSREVWNAMREAFTSQAVDKRYWALVKGPLADEGEIDLPLRHHPRHPDRVEPAVEGGQGARAARSTFTVLSRAGEYSLVEVKIDTGVLHQVRAHLAAIGAAVVGDTLYGGVAEPELTRFFLHAHSLTVDHPTTRQRLRVTCPLPEELVRVLTAHAMAQP